MNYNIKSKCLKAVLIGASLFSLNACTDDFDRLNTNPLYPPYEKPSEPGGGEGEELSPEEIKYLQGIIQESQQIFSKFSYEGVYNDYQRTTSLYHDMYAGYFAHNKPDFNFTTPNYVYADGWMSRRWEHFYLERCKEYVDMSRAFKHIEPEKHRNAYYITRIYFAFLGSLMTDTYGPIPFKTFVDGKMPGKEMPYDSQEVVYDTMFKMLGEAVDSIKVGAPGFKFQGYNDNPYQGDEAKWQRFANSLRLRLALRISNVDPMRAKQEGEAALSAPGGMISSQSDNMTTTPLYALGSGGDENIHALCSFMWKDMVMAEDIELAYKGLSNGVDEVDPRCKVSWYRPTEYEYLMQGEENRRAEYNGSPVGNIDVRHETNVYSVLRCSQSKLDDEKWFGYKRESVWLGYAETKFLQAEAALRGWAGASGTAESLYLDGIRASMEYFKIDAGSIDDYIRGLYYAGGSNPFKTGDKEKSLEYIITQKWLAIFPNGAEGWAEFRRTDYPRLQNVALNQSSDVRQGKFIKRIQFPVSEHEYNLANMPEELKGPKDRQDTRLWWDVEDTNDDGGNRRPANNFR